jgi:hypothetical protein
MRWRSRVGDVKEARSVRGATRRLMYKELKVEEGLEGCPIFAAASDLPYKGCWRAGWLRAQPLDSATCMRLHIARPTCMSSLPWGRPLFAERSPPPPAASVCAGISENIRLFVHGSTAADQWYWLHYYLRVAIPRPLTRKGKLIFDFW